jgi:hypothetical protein
MKRKPEAKGASTPRSTKCRTRQRLRKLFAQHDSAFFLNLQGLYRTRGLDASVWLTLETFLELYSREHREVLARHTISGTERSTALVGGTFVELIRPKAGL